MTELGFRVYTLRVCAPRRVRAAQVRAAFYRRCAMWSTFNGYAVLTRSTYGNPFRITTFLQDFTPCGHTEYQTLYEASMDAQMLGFRGALLSINSLR